MSKFSLLLLGVLLGSACSHRMDLVPVVPGGGSDLTALCSLDEEGHLVIRIRNQGNRMTIASTTLVQFGSGPVIVLPTRPVLPGQEETVKLTPDESCRQGACRFTIRVDGRNEVAESNESNNEVTGECR